MSEISELDKRINYELYLESMVKLDDIASKNRIDNKKCRRTLYGITKSGQQIVFSFKCGIWKCPDCGRPKVMEVAEHLAQVTHNKTTLYEILVPGWRSQKRVVGALSRKKIPFLGIKFGGVTYYVTDVHVSGRDWALADIDRVECINKIASLDTTLIKRVDFTKNWRREKKETKQQEFAYVSTEFSSRKQVEEFINDFGQTLDNEYIQGDLLNVVESMTKYRKGKVLLLNGGIYYI